MKVVTAYILLIFGLGINYIFNISVARYLGPTSYGDFSYALYLFNIYSLIAVFSLDQAALKFIPQVLDAREIKALLQLSSVLFGFFFTIIYCLHVFILIGDERASFAYIFAASIIPFTVLTVNVAILQSEQIIGPRLAFRYVVEPLVKIAAFFALFYYFQLTISPVLALFVALVFTNFLAFSMYKNRLWFFNFRFVSGQYSGVFKKFILPMSLSNAVSVLSGRLDLLILGVIVTATDLGYYSAAFQTAGIITIVLQGIETVYTPIFSAHIGKKNYDKLNEDYQRALRWTMLIASPLIMIFFIYPELAMLPFGKKYEGAEKILQVLCIGQFFLLSLGGANPILILLGKTKNVFCTSIIYALLTMICVGLGANYFGGIGAAIGVTFAIAITNLIRIYYLYRFTGCHSFSLHYLRVLISFILSVAIGFSSKSYLGILGIVMFPLIFILLIIFLGLHEEEKNIIEKIYLTLRGALKKNLF